VIKAGRVVVDGRKVRQPGTQVVPGRTRITVDGKGLDRPVNRIVLLLHKPIGIVSTVSDPEGRPTVLDLCRQYTRGRRLFPVGRLDINTSGLLLITNDGVLCYRLTHPRFTLTRTYLVRVRGLVDDKTLRRLERMTKPSRGAPSAHANVEIVKRIEKVTAIRVTLREGRNRQVRRMCEAVGLRVVKLKREKFGPVSIRGVPLGAVRPLEDRELEKIDRLISTEA